MPVYNAGPYLIDAIASIIEQTMRDWELICVNDGSTDNSRQVLDWFATQDDRIRVVHQQNRGIVDALNGGCAIARAPLICRMDCDDISMAERFEQQSQFMRKNPTCTVVGGSILQIDGDSDPLGMSSLPIEHDDILNNLLHRRPGHFHPTTMIRAAALDAVGGYRKKYEWVEDHDLWLRLAQRGKLANLQEAVLCYRQHAGSVCWQRAAQQRGLMNELLQEAFAARGLKAPEEVLLDADSYRSAAGPGKWARIAAKGGYARSAWKQLKGLIRSDADWKYKTRMTCEVAGRLAWQWIGASLHSRAAIGVPAFAEWHQRVAREIKTLPAGYQRAA